MLDISKLRLTQPSLAGSWAELGNYKEDTYLAKSQPVLGRSRGLSSKEGFMIGSHSFCIVAGVNILRNQGKLFPVFKRDSRHFFKAVLHYCFQKIYKYRTGNHGKCSREDLYVKPALI